MDCAMVDSRVGLQAHYHFVPSGEFDPWVGGGAGYEWTRAREYDSDGTMRVERTLERI